MSALITGPSLAKQTSFGAGLTSPVPQGQAGFGTMVAQQGAQFQQQGGQNLQTGIFGNQSMTSTGLGLTGQTATTNPASIGGNLTQQVPGQLLTSPSFGTLGQSSQPQTGMFGQAPIQPQQTGMFPTQNVPQAATGNFNTLSNMAPQPMPSIKQQDPPKLDKNIK